MPGARLDAPPCRRHWRDRAQSLHCAQSMAVRGGLCLALLSSVGSEGAADTESSRSLPDGASRQLRLAGAGGTASSIGHRGSESETDITFLPSYCLQSSTPLSRRTLRGGVRAASAGAVAAARPRQIGGAGI
ncbi:uncharacterized protein IUM83_10267 [Phytophthora cinnamomi]|uniref:uncharacterized protein n=1 Tax=Phytophthora cinnamomi TaxID=4785 RepID=UPI00355AA968|nr:hypothetical protein IUM83_10267 [Phytophthora cinnamomi]